MQTNRIYAAHARQTLAEASVPCGSEWLGAAEDAILDDESAEDFSSSGIVEDYAHGLLLHNAERLFPSL